MLVEWHTEAAAAAKATVRINVEARQVARGTSLDKVAEYLYHSLLFKGLSGWKRNKGRLTLTSSRTYFDLYLPATDTRPIYSSPLRRTAANDSDEDEQDDTAHHRQLMQKMLNRVDGCMPSAEKRPPDSASPGRYSAAESLRLVDPNPSDLGARSLYGSEVKRHHTATDSRNLVRKLTGELLLHHEVILKNSERGPHLPLSANR